MDEIFVFLSRVPISLNLVLSQKSARLKYYFMLQRYLLLFCLFCLGIKPAFAQLSSTNLPIIKITTTVPIGGSQAPANMSIINNSAGLNAVYDAPEFTGMIGIKLRGNTLVPKLSYTVETWYSYKNEMDTSLLGMPSENDWVLLAMYPDRSLMRSLIAYHLYEQMDYWSPRMQLVELMIDDVYKGVYLFGETIKRDSQRLDIANLKSVDNTYPQISGGYIFKIDEDDSDFWPSNYNPPFASGSQNIKFHFSYPKSSVITGVQRAWIKNYVDSFENRLNSPDFQDTAMGWRSHASHKSFRDYFILNEALGNAEAYRLNTYVWKDKTKKLRAGPPWNWNLSLFNTSSCKAATDTAFMYRHAQYCPTDDFLPPFWWHRLNEDPEFVQEVKCRYKELRQPGQPLDTSSLFAYMDSVDHRLNVQNAQSRNFSLYPIFGTPLHDEPTPLAANYAEEVSRIKQYIKQRLNFLDSKWLSTDCAPVSVRNFANKMNARLSPNPATDLCQLELQLTQAATLKMDLTNVFGQIVWEKQTVLLNAGAQQLKISLKGLPAGVYQLQVRSSKGAATALRLVVR